MKDKSTQELNQRMKELENIATNNKIPTTFKMAASKELVAVKRELFSRRTIGVGKFIDREAFTNKPIRNGELYRQPIMNGFEVIV